VTEPLHDTTTKQAPTLAPRSTQKDLLFTFSPMLCSPAVLLIAAVIFEAGTCILRIAATQPKPLNECYQKLAAFRQDNNTDQTLVSLRELVIVFLLVI